MWPVYVEIEIPWRDIDAAGHVNNAAYFSYMESARVKAFRDVFGWHDPEEIEVIVAEATCTFLRPVRMGEQIVVEIRPGRIGSTSFAFDYEIVDADDRTVAEGETVQVTYDYEKEQKKPIPDRIRELLES